VRRVRLTGGEPLLHRDVVALVARLAELGFEDVALTTNGTRLARLAAPLRAAGLHRLNLSVDSLRADRFRALTRGGDLRRVLAGVEAAIAAGFAPIKLNTVVLRGFNDNEVEPIVRFAWDRGLVPRFLEVMPIGEGRSHMDRFVPADEVRERLGHLLEPAPPEAEPGRGPARYVRSRANPALRVGFITGTSHSFCASCDRLRVSSAGVLRPCLATDDGVNASDLVRSSDVAAITALVAEAWTRKPDGAVWRGCVEDSASRLSMRAIGG
jgi:cyclic pyranopterin phosphate synthase